MKRLAYVAILLVISSVAPAFAGQDGNDDGAVCTQILVHPN